MSNPVILHGEKVPLAVQLTGLLTGESVGCWLTRWSHKGLQLFPVLILNQHAQTRVEGWLAVLCPLCPVAPKGPGRNGG